MKNNENGFSRRQFVGAGAATLAAAATLNSGSGASAQQSGGELESEFLMELLLDLGTRADAGHTQITSVAGGTFSGPRLNGTVLPGGADWVTQVSGHSSLDVRITLLTDDGDHIYMHYTGMIVRNDGGIYWRVTPRFTTASEKYDWLNHIVCVGKNRQVAGKVAYDVFQIL